MIQDVKLRIFLYFPIKRLNAERRKAEKLSAFLSYEGYNRGEE